MFTKTNRIILLVFISIVILVSLFVTLQFASLKSVEKESYNEVSIPLSYYSNCFDESQKEFLKKEITYRNINNDELSLFNYKNDFRLVIWDIKSLHFNNHSNIKLRKNFNIEKEDYFTYTNLVSQEEPFIVFTSKTPLIYTDDVYLNSNSKFRHKEIGEGYLGCELLLNQLSLGNKAGSSEIIISSLSNINASLVIDSSEEILRIFILYSISGAEPDLNLLKHIREPAIQEVQFNNDL